MSLTRDFLQALSHALTVRHLYDPGHPARGEAVEDAYGLLRELLERDASPTFSFLEERVVYGDRPIPEMEGWPPGQKLAGIGMARLELARGVTAEEFEDFVALADERLQSGRSEAGASGEVGEAEEEHPDTEIGEGRFPHIAWGPVQVRRAEASDGAAGASVIDLLDEAEANQWIHHLARERGEVPALEAQAVVRSLSVALHSQRNPVVPVGDLSGLDEYTTVHSLNVAMLSMSLAEEMAYAGEDVYQIGVAALLHDIGKGKTPLEILNKPGRLTDGEFEVIQRHPVDGARMIVEQSPEMRLAAVVAYEHHIQGGGGGYPKVRYPRERHRASRVVQVCDVYDSLRTHRPYRDSMPAEKAVSILEEGTETGQFDGESVEAFLRLLDRVEEIRAEPSAAEEDDAEDGEPEDGGAMAELEAEAEDVETTA